MVGLVSIIGQGLLAGRVTERWGESPLVRAAFVGSAAGFTLLALVGPGAPFVLATALLGFATALLTPAVSALASKRAAVAQGVAMGWTNSAMSLGRVVGPTTAGFLFDADLSYPFLGGAAVMLIGFLVALGAGARQPRATAADPQQAV